MFSGSISCKTTYFNTCTEMGNQLSIVQADKFGMRYQLLPLPFSHMARNLNHVTEAIVLEILNLNPLRLIAEAWSNMLAHIYIRWRQLFNGQHLQEIFTGQRENREQREQGDRSKFHGTAWSELNTCFSFPSMDQFSPITTCSS